ncbi:hypothetical protein PPROV_001126600 [Pycnococcus provasolii]|uniref:Uncharacterized protein n=1 Tax=Pycnococcus provasolii TaxID=41880 RepID=A0A830HZY5_9CHLO|nr:hypothetical protein PPROV_001126600 [Pycnococcus provasolii]
MSCTELKVAGDDRDAEGASRSLAEKDAKLAEINYCYQNDQKFSDWYDTLDVLVTDYKDLGGNYSDEVLLNKMEHLASSKPARPGSHSWAQRIEFARGTFID